MKKAIQILVILLVALPLLTQAQEEQKLKSIAIVSIDTKGLALDNLSMGNLVRIELEKLEKFEVLDKYDASNVMKQNNISPDDCFGKSQLVQVGKVLKADYMMTGSAEKYGEKIILILRLIDVNKQSIDKTSVMEFVYQEEYIQVMVRMSIQDLFGMPQEQEAMDMLVNLDIPITSDKTTLRLNGPRFGMQFFNGEIKKRLEAPLDQGGFNSVAYGSVFGYQHELQYVSKGDFQALFEFIGTINSIETNHPTFSLTVLNGLRWRGWEVGFGPVFRLAKFAEGYYDINGNWVLSQDMPEGEMHSTFKNLDSRGKTELSTGLIIAAGKSFSIGYLNLPVNVYWSPPTRLGSSVVGIMLGFNVAKKPKSKPRE